MPSDITPEEYALLEAIARSESAGAWNVIYGGSTFDDYSSHPAKYVTIESGPNKGRKSSAAGKYQITKTTYDDVAPKLGITDFSPESQMQIALYLARRDYGPNLQKDLEAGKVSKVAKGLSNIWTSLPSGIEAGTNTKKFGKAYNVALASPRPRGNIPSVATQTSLAPPRPLAKPAAFEAQDWKGFNALPAPRLLGAPAPAPKGMQALSEGNAAFGVLPLAKKPLATSYLTGQGIDLTARDLSGGNFTAVPLNALRRTGVGTASLAPATKVKTRRIDPLTNQVIAKAALKPVTPQSREELRAEQRLSLTKPKTNALMASGSRPAITVGTQPARTVVMAAARPSSLPASKSDLQIIGAPVKPTVAAPTTRMPMQKPAAISVATAAKPTQMPLQRPPAMSVAVQPRATVAPRAAAPTVQAKTFTGSATGKTYVVGQIYQSKNGPMVATANGTFAPAGTATSRPASQNVTPVNNSSQVHSTQSQPTGYGSKGYSDAGKSLLAQFGH